MPPEVTVLMPVYNGERYLRESIDSILNQTFTDYEFLIIDDASTDSSRDIILSYDDQRMKLIENEQNIGQSESLNIGFHETQGKYIARMDQDDVSLPLRLEKQVCFMDEHAEVGVCGTYVRFVNDKDRRISHPYLREPMLSNNELKAQLLFSPCFQHPTVMIRSKILLNHEIKYEKEYEPAEDYWMWNQLSAVTEYRNIPEILLKLREHKRQRSRVDMRKQFLGADMVRKQVLQTLFSGKSTKRYELRHMMISRFEHLTGLNDLTDAEEWLCSVLDVNKASKRYDHIALQKVISSVWYYLCMNSTHLGPRVFKRYYSSPLFSSLERIDQHCVFLIKCLIKHRVKLYQMMV